MQQAQTQTDSRPTAGELFAQTHRGQAPRDVRRRLARERVEKAQKTARTAQKRANLGQFDGLGG